MRSPPMVLRIVAASRPVIFANSSAFSGWLPLIQQGAEYAVNQANMGGKHVALLGGFVQRQAQAVALCHLAGLRVDIIKDGAQIALSQGALLLGRQMRKQVDLQIVAALVPPVIVDGEFRLDARLDQVIERHAIPSPLAGELPVVAANIVKVGVGQQCGEHGSGRAAAQDIQRAVEHFGMHRALRILAA